MSPSTPFLFALILAAPAFCQPADGRLETRQERELKACGAADKEVKFAADTDKSKHPTGTAGADTALVYVIRSSMWGSKIQSKVAVDGDWKGVNRGNNYFFFTLTPGEHYFCSQSQNRSIAVIFIEPGKTYYLYQRIRVIAMMVRNDLNLVEDDEGRDMLATAHPSTWKVKHE